MKKSDKMSDLLTELSFIGEDDELTGTSWLDDGSVVSLSGPTATGNDGGFVAWFNLDTDN